MVVDWWLNLNIKPVPKTQKKLKIISELSGAWSNDSTIISIFKAIDQERHSYFGREVSLEPIIGSVAGRTDHDFASVHRHKDEIDAGFCTPKDQYLISDA